MKPPATAVAELLVLPDGRILAHNLTPAVAALLAELNPGDEAMRQRAASVAASAPIPLSNSSSTVRSTVACP